MKKIKTWIKLENHFIDQDNIRAIARMGQRTRIEPIFGEFIVVNIDYDKIAAILPKE